MITRGDLQFVLTRQKLFSERAFGPREEIDRRQGVIDHIRKELAEVEAAPDDLFEWIDLAMLAFDGAWRAGFSPLEVAEAYLAKLEQNEKRQWPDWRRADPNKAIEHVR